MRQRRNKALKSKQPAPCAKGGGPVIPQDPALIELQHQHIPRDAKGDPVFLILPDRLRAKFDLWMANLEAFWLATKDPWAVSEAHTLTLLFRQVPPPWLDVAVHSLAAKRRTKKHAKHVREAAIRSARHVAVRDAQESGLTWDEAYEGAESVCASDPALAGTWDTMRRAYLAVRKDLDAGRGGLYFLPHEQNAAAREALIASRLTPTRARLKEK